MLFPIVGGLVGAFFGAVVALIIQRVKKRQQFPYWWVVTGLTFGALSGLLQLSRYS